MPQQAQLYRMVTTICVNISASPLHHLTKSVTKAVYIDKRALKCGCVGGNSKVSLGFVSLTENIFMILSAGLMWIS